MTGKKIITIIGNYIAELFLKGDRLPTVSEIVMGHTFLNGTGGKGSNQAVAASMFGTQPRFIACLDNNRYGEDALDMYEQFGIDTSPIFIDHSTHTGFGAILIDADGWNSTAVIPGTNFNMSPDDIQISK